MVGRQRIAASCDDLAPISYTAGLTGALPNQHAPMLKKVRFVVDEKASMAVQRPLVLRSVAQVVAEEERGRLSLPVREEVDSVDDAYRYARWQMVSLYDPPS